MISSYEAGYYAGRWCTKIVKVYLASKLVKSTLSKVVKFSKHHKIDSKNAGAVTENVFECLQYLD
jgi:hypothetical protein